MNAKEKKIKWKIKPDRIASDLLTPSKTKEIVQIVSTVPRPNMPRMGIVNKTITKDKPKITYLVFNSIPMARNTQKLMK
jgi:hypothetical protein